NTNPATIDLNFEKALDWLQKGAQPTDTCRAILSEKGVLYKKHLLGGVAKGAFSESDADACFNKWMAEKDEKNAGKVSKLAGDARAAEKARLTAEAKVKEDKAAAIAAKKAEATAAPAEEEAVVEEVAVEEAAAPAEETAPAEEAGEVAAAE
ncbi:MAG: 30S ribosomal protein S16, partial [Rikenellaceae bacterium]|nr:30S ribosomal protein S16 [Rikenellaceae bacterium]